jgi:hypothetical protein
MGYMPMHAMPLLQCSECCWHSDPLVIFIELAVPGPPDNEVLLSHDTATFPRSNSTLSRLLAIPSRRETKTKMTLARYS